MYKKDEITSYKNDLDEGRISRHVLDFYHYSFELWAQFFVKETN